MTTYKASPIKRNRRTKLDIFRLKTGLLEIIDEQKPMTVRQVFYQAVGQALIDKTEAEYKNTICRLLVEMRKSGEMPYEWIVDNTRWMRKPTTYSSMSRMLALTQQTYRRAIWDDQNAYVEIWLEKEALAGVLVDVTAAWDVPLMVTRGYPSISYVHEAAQMIASQGKPAYLYYFGDHDPSGVDIDRFVEEQIPAIAPDVDMEFVRVAVLPEQIEEMSLPTRPTKKTDSRSGSFKGESVEVDAIPPSELRSLCEYCIRRHIDEDVYEKTLEIEEQERATLAMIADDYFEGAA